MIKKYGFMGDPASNIYIQYFEGSESIELHYHDFYELVIIRRGSCIYKLASSETLLVTGDVFLIPPHQPHGYEYDTKMEFYNCQFYADKLGKHWDSFLNEMAFDSRKDMFSMQYDLQDISMLEGDSRFEHREFPTIIHLNGGEQKKLEEFLQYLNTEEKEKKTGYEHIKSSYLTIIITYLRRIQEERASALNTKLLYDARKTRISMAIDYVNENYMEEIHFGNMAEEYGLSAGHFRELFKKATGLTPVDYLNRLRIVKSLEYIRTEDLSIAEAAGRVGIYDANYFSRLFKKVMGYSPRYFKNITG